MNSVRGKLKTTLVGYGFVLPALVILALFTIYPMLRVIQYSFLQWDIMGSKHWIGLGNYLALLHDSTFLRAIANTIVYAALSLIFIYTASLLGAVLMNQSLRGQSIFRTSYFLPSLIPTVAIGLAWQGIFDPSNGLLNTLLRFLGLNSLALQWLANPKTALYCVIFVNIWQWWGYNMMLFLAGLQTISNDIVEAARVDGASAFTTFLRITWPLLKPVSIVVIITTIIGSFKAFDLVYVMTGGGPFEKSTVIVLDLFRQGFQFMKFGYASAMSVVLLIIVLIWSGLQMWFSRTDAE
ncbi:MAG: sugar ABC transporter permease [Alicyclobacillus shizuokensis]|nr:sugar ABC transporter permease [Alicyclobacillus shizuokensis]